VSIGENLRDVFTRQDGIYLVWARNTIVYAGTAAIGAGALATAAGYAFAKLRFRGSNALFAFVLGAIMIPLTALAIPTYLLFAKVELTDTPWAVILPSLVSPFGVYLMRVYAESAVDDTLLEAARVDGAGEFRIFVQIVLRLLAPGFITVVLFALVATWNNYFLPLIMLNSPEWYPLTVGLAQWQATSQAGAGSQALFSMVITGSLVSIIPLVVAFLFLQRYWQTGLTAGGVKQ
jgi:multiple sugar transport system permease protein